MILISFQVHPAQYSDARTRFFVYWTVSSSEKYIFAEECSNNNISTSVIDNLHALSFSFSVRLMDTRKQVASTLLVMDSCKLAPKLLLVELLSPVLVHFNNSMSSQSTSSW